MKYLKRNSLILVLVFVASTFLAMAASPAVKAYGEFTEVSPEDDTSIPIDDSQPVLETPTVTPTIMPTPEAPAIPDIFEAEGPQAQLKSPADTITVHDYEDLLLALSTDNSYEIIYFGNNIIADARGIAIHPSKHNIIIDGAEYTFTQFGDSSPAATIHLAAENTTTKNITLQNITLKGNNSNGIVFIPANLADVTVRYQNVIYSGPQAVSNFQGSVHLIASNFTMYEDVNADSQYVVEANHIQLGEAIVVESNNNTEQILDAVLLPTGENPHLDVLANAFVDIKVYGYFLDVHTHTVDITIGESSFFDITGQSGFTPLGKDIRNMTIAPHATVKVIQTLPQTLGVLRIEDTLKMEPGSNLLVTRMRNAGSPIIFSSAGGKAIFDNPERVILYSDSDHSIFFEEEGSIEINTSTINVWIGGKLPLFDNPDYIWNNSKNQLFSVSDDYIGELSTNLTHSLQDNAPITDALTSTSFNLSDMTLLILGRLDLTVDPIHLNDTALTGVTEATLDAYDVIVNATYEGLPEPLLGQLADSDGNFSFSIDPETLSLQNALTVTSSFNSLIKREILFPRDIPTGELVFTNVSNILEFDTTVIPETPTTIPRTNGNFSLSVSDTRNFPSPWRVNARIVEPLTAVLPDKRKVTLPDALVFINELGESTPLTSASLPIHYENSLVASEFDVTWGEDRGLLLDISPGDIYSNATYSTTIYWSLVNAP